MSATSVSMWRERAGHANVSENYAGFRTLSLCRVSKGTTASGNAFEKNSATM